MFHPHTNPYILINVPTCAHKYHHYHSSLQLSSSSLSSLLGKLLIWDTRKEDGPVHDVSTLSLITYYNHNHNHHIIMHVHLCARTYLSHALGGEGPQSGRKLSIFQPS